MSLASKFVGMNIKKVSDQLPSGATVKAAFEIDDAKDASKAADTIKQTMNSNRGSLLVLAIRIK